MHITSDGSKVMFIGKDKYVYIFDAPDSLRTALAISFVDKMSVLLRHDRGYFQVSETGSVDVTFALASRIRDLEPSQIQLLLANDFIQGVRHGGEIYKPEHLHITCKDCPELIPDDARWLILKQISMSGRRFFKSGNESLVTYASRKIPSKQIVSFIDLQNKEIDLFAPAMLAVGTTACFAMAPLCFSAALPMIGMKP